MEYKDFAINLAKKAGEIIRTNFVLDMKKEWKENNTPLTETDTFINRLVIESVEKAYPTHEVFGEEESTKRTNAEYLWVCDPIDGTIPFSHGMPVSTFSLALLKDGEPILGVIYDPYMDRLFFAEKGKGTTLNGHAVHVSSRLLPQSVVTVEGSISLTATYEYLPYLIKKEKAKVIRLNSYVYGGMLVAAGELVAAVFGNDSPWDVAAVKIIVDEAGGKTSDVYGNDQRYDQDVKGFVATNGHVHDTILKMIAIAMKENPL